MPKFSEFFRINASQAELDFVDVSTDYDTPVYVDPYAIEIRNDVWAEQASDYIRVFFLKFWMLFETEMIFVLRI